RLLECAQLRIKDVDFAANQLVVRSGKGAKDRVTMLPTAAKTRLLAQIEAVRRQHRVDLEAGAGWGAVPDALARKYPKDGRAVRPLPVARSTGCSTHERGYHIRGRRRAAYPDSFRPKNAGQPRHRATQSDHPGQSADTGYAA